MNEAIDFFFKNPNVFTDEPGKKSILYLLRRDIMTCFGLDANTNEPIQTAAFFPGTMATMAGIDLLAKFYEGNDEIKNSKKRFLAFVKEYIDDTHGDIIYQLRNALIHSFGTYSKGKDGMQYRFKLDTESPQLITQIDETNYLVNIKLLREQFESGCEQYYKDLFYSSALRQKFMWVFEQYGFIFIH
jgi:hypothetical protein